MKLRAAFPRCQPREHAGVARTACDAAAIRPFEQWDQVLAGETEAIPQLGGSRRAELGERRLERGAELGEGRLGGVALLVHLLRRAFTRQMGEQRAHRRARELALELGQRGHLPARFAQAAHERLVRRLAEAGWQVPTLSELEREFPGAPVRALLAHLAREGAAEQMDQERYAAKAALAEFRAALEAALAELGSATPAELRDRFGLTRKYLIPLLEWADRRGVTRRSGDARVLARLTAGKGRP